MLPSYTPLVNKYTLLTTVIPHIPPLTSQVHSSCLRCLVAARRRKTANRHPSHDEEYGESPLTHQPSQPGLCSYIRRHSLPSPGASVHPCIFRAHKPVSTSPQKSPFNHTVIPSFRSKLVLHKGKQPRVCSTYAPQNVPSPSHKLNCQEVHALSVFP